MNSIFAPLVMVAFAGVGISQMGQTQYYDHNYETVMSEMNKGQKTVLVEDELQVSDKQKVLKVAIEKGYHVADRPGEIILTKE